MNTHTADPEFLNTPQHEFNLWFDPEAAHIMLRAPWKKIVCTTVDVSVKTRMTQALIDKIKAGDSPAARYVGKYARLWGEYNYLWDELAAAAWLDPSLITKQDSLYMDIDYSHGAGYGNTLVWNEGSQPGLGEQLVHVQQDLNLEKFNKMFIDLIARPTPGAHPAAK